MVKQQQYIHGFTLIEVLVSVLILAIGLLGLAGLQVTGLRSVNNASLYTQGTLALNDIIERMRSNPIAIANNDYLLNVNAAGFLETNTTVDIDCSVLPAPYCSQYNTGSTLNQVAAAKCTPAEMAAYDVNVWFCGEQTGGGARTAPMSTLFPQATATIVCDDNLDHTDAVPCNNGSQYTLALSWQEQNPDKMDLNGDGEPDDTIPKTITMTINP